MEEPAERGRCAACARLGPSWHGTGPFLLVCGDDDASARAAALIAEQCLEHEVEALVVSVGEVPRSRLWAFTTVVFILPLTSDIEIHPTLATYVAILDTYRAKRHDGLAEIRRLAWYFRGTAIWVGPRALLDNPLLHRALRRSDARYYVEDGPADVFDPFGPNSLVVEAAKIIYSNSTEDRFFGKLAVWGIRSEDARPIKEMIDDYRETFDLPKYTAINGRKYDLDTNLFNLVLSNSINSAMKAQISAERWETFVGDANRACRAVIRAIMTNFPEFHLPPNRSTVRQEDIRDLYRMLRLAVNHLDRRSDDEQSPD